MTYRIRQTSGGRYLIQNGMRELHNNQYSTRNAALEAIEKLQKGLVKFMPSGILIEKEDLHAMGVRY